MVELPPEILHMICVALNGRSVTDFREVCRTWAIIGAEYLIPTVYFQLHPTSFLRLEAISKHPVLRHHVRALIYEANTLPQYETYGEWLEGYHSYSDGSIDSDEVSSDDEPSGDDELPESPRKIEPSTVEERIDSNEVLELEEPERALMWVRYQAFLTDQDQLRAICGDACTITAVLRRFPNLQEVGMIMQSDLEADQPFPERSQSFKRLYSDLLWPLDSEHSEDCGLEQATTLLDCVSRAEIKPNALTLGKVSWMFFDMDEIGIALFKPTFQHLAHIQLWISLEGFKWYRKFEAGFFDPGLQAFLSWAPVLRTLQLYLKDMVPVLLPVVLKDSFWPCLTSLAIQNLQANAEEFLNFLRKHSGTLVHLSLGDFYVLEGTLGYVFRQLPVILKLKDVFLWGEMGMDDAYSWPPEYPSVYPCPLNIVTKETAEELGVPPNTTPHDMLTSLLCRRTYELDGKKALLDQLLDAMGLPEEGYSSDASNGSGTDNSSEGDTQV